MIYFKIQAMVSTKSPLAQLTMLKKIADHPRLLSSGVCETLGLSENMYDFVLLFLVIIGFFFRYHFQYSIDFQGLPFSAISSSI